MRRWKADRVSCDNAVDHRLDDRCSDDLIASGYDRCSDDLIASGYDRCSHDHNHHVDHLGTPGIHAHAGTWTF
ncbi:MAG: hypothetical protein MK174_04040 [Acidimicrobiales bacterium]|nr:hypothetical protein [Acidimicrobiales bacterium]